MRWACIHDKHPMLAGAPEPCGKVAFFMLKPLVDGEIAQPEDFRMPDGTMPVMGEPIRCGGCGEYLNLNFADHILSIIPEA